MPRKKVIIDGNEAAAYIAHKTNEVIAIYPITPSSPMGEQSDMWSALGQTNIWGTVPTVVELQSEGGAAGAVHGALQTGALTTTFTASQGLLLMIPNMYKIAGELTATVFHVSARTIATHALSIFGDHSDVMATRSTGFALLASNSVQEVMDFALIAQAAALESRIPFLHFFDGFRTSHEVMKIEQLTDGDIRAMISDELVFAHRKRGLSPNEPVLRGTAHNPDTYFQAREAVNPFYDATAEIVQAAMDKFAGIAGRQYHLFDYEGHPEADRLIVLMGSGAETAHETVAQMVKNGEKVGLLKVRLYRPFSMKHFIEAIPDSVQAIAVLDRTKEPGALGEPLYQDVVTALSEGGKTAGRVVVGGRYGLSSKEFTPQMVKGLFDELKQDRPRNHFTIGITDDVTNTSLSEDSDFRTADDTSFRGMFFGLGSDGTVGANKNSIKIIGEETDNYAQGYFVYDSKKSGSMTISHLRFGGEPIQSTYLIREANFVACHNVEFLKTIDILQHVLPGGTFLLNSPRPAEEVWDSLPRNVQAEVRRKNVKTYSINALEVAQKTGMGGRINTIMQTCFFAISGVLPREEAIGKIKNAIKKTYGKKGEEIVKKNFLAVDQTLANLHQIEIPGSLSGVESSGLQIPVAAPEFVRSVTARLIAGKGDSVPVSAMPADGTWPTDTCQYEKRNIATEIPVWSADICIQCNKCALVCPHGVIRPKIYSTQTLDGAPETFKQVAARGREWDDSFAYTLQVAPEDCTGCALCVEACPVKDKTNVSLRAINMEPQAPIRDSERANWEFFLTLPETDRSLVNHGTVKGSQILEPLFEFSGACSGCGETPYVKLASQLFGDRMVVANATGCSSIYGGNLPTTPWAKNNAGRGPAWSNSLFEDNAEFGLGFRLAIDKQREQARELVSELKKTIGGDLTDSILTADQTDEPGIFEQRKRVEAMNAILKKHTTDPKARLLLTLSENLTKKSVWIMGGDGWAYDIGFGGLDHVLASGKDVNILVLDTEVYSNTGGQASKSTPLGAVAKFASSGKSTMKKDLGMIAMSYGDVYVAKVAMGASDAQTVKAFMEAEAYPGVSIIIAYSHCIAHGINMVKGLEQQQLAVDSGHWPLFRYNPTLHAQGKNPLSLDSKPPKIHIRDYIYQENRYKMLIKSMPERAEKLLEQAERQAKEHYEYYNKLSRLEPASSAGKGDQ